MGLNEKEKRLQFKDGSQPGDGARVTDLVVL